MTSSPEGTHKFNVRVAYPDRIHRLLKMPTFTESFGGIFGPYDFGDIPYQQNTTTDLLSQGLVYLLATLKVPLKVLGNAHLLGEISLEPPLSGISVSTISNGRQFSSLSQIRVSPDYMEVSGQRVLPFAEDFLRARFMLHKMDDRLAILGEDGNPEFPEFEIARVHTQVGSMLVENGLNIGFGGRSLVMARAVSTPEETQAWMERYAFVITTVVNAIYEGAQQSSPDVTFFLWV